MSVSRILLDAALVALVAMSVATVAIALVSP